MARSPAKAKPVSLALQGGGAHGAFTWGVLERLSECETLDIQAITATSAGAMNAAAYLSGLATGGRQGGREALEGQALFWARCPAAERTSGHCSPPPACRPLA